MYKCFIFTISLFLSSLSLSAQDSQIDYMKGKVVLKLKQQVNASVNEQINASYNHNSFGITGLDETLNELSIKDIQQKFPHHSTPAFQSKIENQFGSDVQTLENIYELNFDDNIPVKYVIKQLSRNSNIEYAEPVYIAEAYAEPNDPRYVEQQFLPQIMASDAWDIAKGQNGEEVIIGICDSGVEWHHPDLIDNFWYNPGEDADGDGVVIQYNEETEQWEFDPDDINGIDDDNNGYVDDLSGWNFVSNFDGTPQYDIDGSTKNSHGTHVSGLAAAVTDNSTGVASISWNVKFIGTKHSPNDNGRSVYYGYDGIVYLSENGADIINMSWGGGSYSFYQQEVISYANSLGVILVASAGNNNTPNNHYPSSYSGIVNVASVASTDAKAYYSTYGTTVDISSPGGDRYVDGGVLATIPDHSYAKYQGTSMASPVAAGLFALVQSYFPEKTDKEIIKQILGTTDDISAENPNFDNMLGTGRINALRALTEEPQYEEGLMLTILSSNILEYDEETGEYYNADVILGGSAGMLQLIVKNDNNFYGQDLTIFNATSNTEEIEFIEHNFVQSLAPDGYTVLEIPFYANEDIETGFHSIAVTAYDQYTDIIYGGEINTELFINNSDILVWQPILNGEDMSGEYLYNYYEENGFNVYLSTQVLPSLDGFEAVFFSFGNTTAPAYNTYMFNIYQMLYNLNLYSYEYGQDAKIYFESANFLTHYNPYFIGQLNYQLFGLSSADYNEGQTVTLDNIFGSEGAVFEGLNFTSNQNNTYELNYLTPATDDLPYAESVFEQEGFGSIAVAAYNNLGNTCFTTSATLSELVDTRCPNSKENLMRQLNYFFGLQAPLEFTIPDEVETCEGTPVELGINDTECIDNYPIVNIVTGGSGVFDVEWTPEYGLDDPYSSNPVMLNPLVNRVYQVTVTDLEYGDVITKNVQVEVNHGAKVKVPLIKMHTYGNPINLNDQIISIIGGEEPYLEYNWTKNNQPVLDPENEMPAIGVNRYYLNIVDSQGCVSNTVRMIVFVSFYKQFAENDISVGNNGTIVATAYPNPANNEINLLTVFEENTNATISIVDLEGNEIYNETKNSINEINQSISISSIPAGTYFIKVESDNDSVVKKFIKE